MTPHTHNSVWYRRVEEGLAELGYLPTYLKYHPIYLHNIRIFNGCEVLIENSVARVTIRLHGRLVE